MATIIASPTTETTAVLFYITLILCMFIMSPILIYWSWKFNQYKNTIVLSKRYPNIIRIILIFLVFLIFLRVPLSIIAHTPTTLPILGTIHHNDAFIIIESFIYVYISHGAVMLIALRFWMIFYKINYTYSSSTSGM